VRSGRRPLGYRKADIEKQVLVTKMTEITHRCIGSAMEHINIVLREHPASNIGEAGQAGRALISSRGKAAR
jgi:phenylpyruvate tautomerase PptA (4-oxalocrotonate tautomerase family)